MAWVSWHQKGKPFWILTKKEMMGGSGISWTICKSFPPCSIQITTPILHHSVLQARCPFCRLTNRVKALKAKDLTVNKTKNYARSHSVSKVLQH